MATESAATGTTATGTAKSTETTTSGSTSAVDSTLGEASSSTTAAQTTSSGSNTESSSSESSSEGTTSGIAAFDVPFSVLDPADLPLTSRVESGFVVLTSVAEWDAATGGAPLPMGVSFPRQWLVFGSRGPQPFPGHALEVSALTWDAGALVVDGNAVEPDVDCETFQFIWPADTLLMIDALEVEVNAVDDQTMPLATSCALGAGDSEFCDLATPCATGLLCAGLIRSTVLGGMPSGFCLPTSNAGVFTGGALAIPANGTSAETSLLVTGLTSVDMDVVIWVELDHPAPEELVIELRNPDGNQVSVADLQTSPLHPGGVGIVPTGFSGDESVNGTWWLVVSDELANGNNGAVVSWELEIMSRFD